LRIDYNTTKFTKRTKKNNLKIKPFVVFVFFVVVIEIDRRNDLCRHI